MIDATTRPRALSVRTNFLALSTGRVLAAVAQWAALIVIAKSADVETVGVFALAQVICITAAEIARMGLRDVKATDVDRAYTFGEYLGLRIVVAAMAYACMLVVGAVAADSFTVFVVIAVYALSRVVELLSDIVYGLFQVQHRLDYVGRSLAIVAPSSLLLLTAGYALTDSLVGAVAGQLLAYLAVFVFHDLALARRRIVLEPGESVRPSFVTARLGGLFRIALPLAVAGVLGMMALELPRVLVAASLGTESLGVFAPLFVLAMAPSRLVNALGTAATTPLATRYAAGDRGGFVRLLGTVAAVAAAMGVVGVAVVVVGGEWILRTVYTDEYVSYHDLFVVLGIAGALRFEAQLLQYGLVAARRFWWLTTQLGIVATVAVIAGLVLVPRGLDEAAAAVVIVVATHLAVIGFAVARNLPAPPTTGEVRGAA